MYFQKTFINIMDIMNNQMVTIKVKHYIPTAP